MIFPALKWATNFPIGSESEGLDLLLRESSNRHLRARSECQQPLFSERMKREFFTPERSFSRPTYYYPRCLNSGFPTTDANYNVSEPARLQQGYTINRYGINRPDHDIQFNSLARRTGNLTANHRSGCSSSYADRSKYLPSTPKVRTQFPRFHTGFQY
eukprot:GFUD01015963.1.p1 GENE.GFUD01015963.1~~GFUD01015963.1.p1  ORF type:complete len:158 (+),score=18.20 GFUD01015963.1:54-527(+)